MEGGKENERTRNIKQKKEELIMTKERPWKKRKERKEKSLKSDLNYERRNIQEAVSFYPIQELSPRPVWPAGNFKEVIGTAIHESFSKHSTFSIAINLKLLLVF